MFVGVVMYTGAYYFLGKYYGTIPRTAIVSWKPYRSKVPTGNVRWRTRKGWFITIEHGKSGEISLPFTQKGLKQLTLGREDSKAATASDRLWTASTNNR